MTTQIYQSIMAAQNCAATAMVLVHKEKQKKQKITYET